MILFAFVLDTSVSPQSHLPNGPAARFLSHRPPSFEYRAWRRLEAANARFNQSGWLEAETWVNAAGFGYRILREGGSERIRNKVLRAALDGERALLGSPGDTALSPDNYTFTDDGEQDGLAKVRVVPRRRAPSLIDGHLFVVPASADLREIRGRLAKSPSFWISRVDVVRRYQYIAHVRVPVSTESTALVRLAGRSTFAMRYVYQAINGQPVAADGSR